MSGHSSLVALLARVDRLCLLAVAWLLLGASSSTLADQCDAEKTAWEDAGKTEATRGPLFACIKMEAVRIAAEVKALDDLPSDRAAAGASLSALAAAYESAAGRLDSLVAKVAGGTNDVDSLRQLREVADSLEISRASAELTIRQRDPFFAEVVTGAVFGRDDAGDTSSAQSESILIQWHTNGFGFRKAGEKADSYLRASGRLGLTPFSSTASNGTTDAVVSVKGLIWNARLEGRHARDHSEFVGFAGIGQTWQLSEAAKVERETTTGTERLELKLQGDAVAAQVEVGVELQVFRSNRVRRRAGLGGSASLTAGAAYRVDNRFAPGGVEHRKRLVLRFDLAELNVTGAAPGSEPFTIRFGVEHERAWFGTKGAAAITRLVLAGDLHLLQLGKK